MKTSDRARRKRSKSRALSQSGKPPRRRKFIVLVITSKETGEELCRVDLPWPLYSRIRLAMKQNNWTFDRFFAEAVNCAVEEGICVKPGQGRARR